MPIDKITLVVQALIKYGPDVARAVKELFDKDNPTAADWERVFLTASKSYEELVPATRIPPGE